MKLNSPARNNNFVPTSPSIEKKQEIEPELLSEVFKEEVVLTLHFAVGGWSDSELDRALEQHHNFVGSSADFRKELARLARIDAKDWQNERLNLPPLLSAHVAELRSVKDSIFRQLANFHVADLDDFKFRVTTAIEECLTNHEAHGNRRNPRKAITIEACFAATRETNRLKALITYTKDEGVGYAVGAVQDPCTEENLERAAGRGLLLMNAYANSAKMVENGSGCIMTFLPGVKPVAAG